MFHIMGPTGQNEARRYVYKEFARWQYQLDVKTTTEFGTGANSAIYD